MFSLTAVQRRCFEILLVLILVFDLTFQVVYLRGPLFTIPQITQWAPWLGAILGLGALIWTPGRRPLIALLALLHYAVTCTSVHMYSTSEADSWVWLLALVLVCIPDDGAMTEDFWVGVLKLVGFLVYFFAGLNKAIHWEWWNGQTLLTIIRDPSVTKGPFQIFASMPKVCMVLGWVTLFQRLVVPWGLFSSRVLVRRICAGILVAMHISYMFTLDVGTFSWVGILYLSLFFFPNAPSKNGYFHWPPANSARLATASLFAGFLVLMPLLAFAGKFGFPGADLESAMTPRGFGMRWNMFAESFVKTPLITYSIKTCSGQLLGDENVYWNFGSNTSYFRRRFLVRMMDYEIFSEASHGYTGTPGPLEEKLIQNFPEKIAERRVQIFSFGQRDKKLEYDSGSQVLSDCSERVVQNEKVQLQPRVH